MEQSTGVGVLDKIDLILTAIEVEPCSLNQLSATTGIPRPTAHRLATALEQRRYLERDDNGRFCLGPRIAELAASDGDDWLVGVATPILTRLRDATSASAQLYRRRGGNRLCVASVEPTSGLRDSVPAGTLLPMSAGSAAQVMVAWGTPEQILESCEGSRFTPADLARVRKRGWAHTVGERESGLASLSAPVRGESPEVVAAVSVSGPVERIGRTVKAPLAEAVLTAAEHLSAVIASR
ncbi:MAG: IclR family transcriptional regulator [Actinobacteria bacterium]|nr:IclR family transcriptional regulator [Actinomycetota bacterium]